MFFIFPIYHLNVGMMAIFQDGRQFMSLSNQNIAIESDAKTETKDFGVWKFHTSSQLEEDEDVWHK